mgnify:CR=1 FL=1|tara:strand:+ start:55 stop:252 length:198 start_codon:yes stop_codon:yes gene_type:complete
MNNEFTDKQKSFIFDHLNNDAQCFILIHGWDEFINHVQNPNSWPAMVKPSAANRIDEILDQALAL